MSITSVGYGGTVTEDKIAGWRRSFPATYGVVTASDWAVSLKTGVDRTVGVAAGTAFGHAVTDVNSAEITKQLDTLASGTRYDLIVARRNWVGAGGTTTLEAVTGTSSQTAVFASRNQNPGTLDDQPLALVKVTGNGAGGVIAQIYDLRVWAANGGAVAALNATGLDGTPLVLQYLNEAGTEVWYGTELWHRYVDGSGSLQWAQTGGAPAFANVGFGPSGALSNSAPGQYTTATISWTPTRSGTADVRAVLDIILGGVGDPGSDLEFQGAAFRVDVGGTTGTYRWIFNPNAVGTATTRQYLEVPGIPVSVRAGVPVAIALYVWVYAGAGSVTFNPSSWEIRVS